jgi:hypothetical protein
MSRKDYRAMAEILATAATFQQVRERLAHYLACDNPRFDHGRFMEASAPRTTQQDP